MTNVVEFWPAAHIESQARRWLIRMDGDEPLTQAEADALRAWMARSPLHRAELVRLLRFWDDADILSELVDSVGSPAHRGTSWLIKAARTALAVAVLVISVGCLQSDEGLPRHYQTAKGERKTIVLLDGSLVLHDDSAVQVTSSGGKISVRLIKGEAYFSVKPDPDISLAVYVADDVVRASGTEFVVHVDQSKVDLTVSQGVVVLARIADHENPMRILHPGSPETTWALGQLKAGQATTVDYDTTRIDIQDLAETELRQRVAWHEG